MMHTHCPAVIGAIAIAAAMVAGPVPDASADDLSRARVVTRDSTGQPSVIHVPVDPHRPEAAQVVVRRVVEPAAVVSRELSEQPVLPHLAEVKLGSTTILIDPQVDYRRAVGGIDRNHTIRRAQRIHREVQQVQQPGAGRVIRSPHADADGSAGRADREPLPRAIFLRPDILGPPPAPQEQEPPGLPEVQHRDDSPPSPTPSIPHVPAPPSEKWDLLVQIEDPQPAR